MEQMEALKQSIREKGKMVVAFSGGVDSTFLLKVAHDVLGDGAVAVTARSCSFPERELREAKAFCEKEHIKHIVVESEELQIEGFSHNPTNRCYLCKKELFTKIWDIAKEYDIPYVAEASNLDDNGDYRPGLMAVAELSVLSPLREAGMNKSMIRELSHGLGTIFKRKILKFYDRFHSEILVFLSCGTSRLLYLIIIPNGRKSARNRSHFAPRLRALCLLLSFCCCRNPPSPP
jgi:uncharacterized protein (TIGR00268 family)